MQEGCTAYSMAGISRENVNGKMVIRVMNDTKLSHAKDPGIDLLCLAAGFKPSC